MIGMQELLVILAIVLLVFGAGKLPQVGDALGRSIRNFKKATQGDEIDVTPRKDELGSGGGTQKVASAESKEAEKA